jgi:hypothetical protein
VAACKVAPIKLQTQNIIKMKIIKYIPMNYYIKLTLYRLTLHTRHGIIGGLNQSMRGGAVAARRAHNPKVAGSSPAPATKKALSECLFVLMSTSYDEVD